MSAPGSFPWEILAPQPPICVMIFGAKMPHMAPLHSALGEWTQYKYYNCDNLERISHLRTSNPTWWDKLVDLGHSQNWPLGAKIGQKWPKLLKNGSKISFVGFDGSRRFKLNGKEL